VDAGFSMLTAHDLLSKDVDELKTLVRQRRETEATKREKERRPRERERDRPADGRPKPERRVAEEKAGPGADARARHASIPAAACAPRRFACLHGARSARNPNVRARARNTPHCLTPAPPRRTPQSRWRTTSRRARPR
jgi:hypothetical protein